MDSISQFALGAAIGELTLGHRLGRKAMLVGGLVATLPDLDVLVQYADAVASFTYHRSWSHSLLVLSLMSPILAWVLYRVYPNPSASPNATAQLTPQSPSFINWFWCVFLVLFTHPILDGFTVYGTQLFWPLAGQPVAWGSVFIIDPMYTVPLIIALVVGYRNRRVARRIVLAGLIISTAYLGLTLVIQQHVRSIAIQSLEDQDLGTANVLVAPSPLSVLWRVVSMDGAKYHEGLYSLFDQHQQMRFVSYDSNRAIIEKQYEHWSISRMDWFTNGMISASTEGDKLIINDLRMGVEASYVFGFLVGQWSESEFVVSQSVQLPFQMDRARIRGMVRRVWDENANVDP